MQIFKRTIYNIIIPKKKIFQNIFFGILYNLSMNNDNINVNQSQGLQVGFVKLGIRNESHKNPIERDWQNKIPSIQEIRQHIIKGGGVGINIMYSPFAYVLDIDKSNSSSYNIAKYFGEKGALVCVTPNGGFHIFLPKDEKFDLHVETIKKVGKDVILVAGENYEYETECEFYTCLSPRNIVLPISNTPRGRLGGVVWYVNGKELKRAVSFDEFLSILNGGEIVIGNKYERVIIKDEAKWKLLKAKNRKVNIKVSSDTRIRWNDVLGKSWLDVTEDEIIEIMRNLKEGERNSKMLVLQMIFKLRGFKGVDKLKKAYEECKQGVDNWEREFDAAWEGLDKITDKYEVIEVFDKLQPNGKPQRSDGIIDVNIVSDKSEEDKYSLISEKTYAIFGDDVKWCEFGGERYIVHDGFLFSAKDIPSYAARRDIGVNVNKERAEQILNYVCANYERINNFFVVKGSLVYEKYLCVAAELGGTKGILACKDNELKFYRHGELEDHYTFYSGSYRKIDGCLEDFDANFDYFVNEVYPYLAKYEEEDVKRAIVAALLATIVGRVILFLLGQSGQGKSSLARLLQIIADGEDSDLSFKDPKNLLLAASSLKIIVKDELEKMPNADIDDVHRIVDKGKVMTRRLYTNNDWVIIRSNSSFVVPTVDISSIRGDTLRRSAAIEIKRSTGINLNAGNIYTNWSRMSEKMMVAIMYLSRDYDLSEDSRLYKMAPYYIKSSGNVNFALTYYYFAKKLRVPEHIIKLTWYEIRFGKLKDKIGIWYKVCERYEETLGLKGEFAEKMENGMLAKDIVLAVYDLDENESKDNRLVRSAMTFLSNSFNKVKSSLEEMGYIINRIETKDDRKRKRIIYTMKKKGDEPINEIKRERISWSKFVDNDVFIRGEEQVESNNSNEDVKVESISESKELVVEANAKESQDVVDNNIFQKQELTIADILVRMADTYRISKERLKDNPQKLNEKFGIFYKYLQIVDKYVENLSQKEHAEYVRRIGYMMAARMKYEDIDEQMKSFGGVDRNFYEELRRELREYAKKVWNEL